MSNKEKIKDKRIEKLLKKIGKGAGLSLDYSFYSDKQEIVGVFFDNKSLKTGFLDDQEVLIPERGVSFFLMTEDEFSNPDIELFSQKLKDSYDNKKDIE